jgi:arabinan endo-1,5-alpha-L-arabinosidase
MKKQFLLFVALLFLGGTMLNAQPGAHDPSRMTQNTDGRYWIFTTGQGIYAMSAPSTSFSGSRTEVTPFGSGYPSWVKNYVTGFTGFFWAPDVIKVGSYYWLYYSCAGTGAPAAIGMTRATNLAGPWTDQGCVVHGNNCIDPAPMIDGSSIWLTWGNWQSGIDACRLNTTTGLKLNSSTYHLLSGQVEGPYVIKNGSYYYLFFQRGLCCNGVNSTYYTCVMRSTTMTGGFSGERVFLPNKNGRVIGPGHVGYGCGKLTYHFYDGNDNGAPKLAITTLSWGSDGWPVAGSYKSGTEIMDDANTNGSVAVYPNPSKGNFTVSGLKAESTITVMDIQGNEVFTSLSGQSENAEVNANLKPGTYIIRVENNNGVAIKKLVVQ